MKLQTAGALLIAGFVIHNVDHARRGFDAITDAVAWGGTLVALLAAVVLTLVFTGHRRAPALAAIVGPTIAVGVSASHLVPDWGPLSDSLIGAGADTLTWIAVFAEIAAALVFGAVGFRIVRRNTWAFEIPAPVWT